MGSIPNKSHLQVYKSTQVVANRKRAQNRTDFVIKVVCHVDASLKVNVVTTFGPL